MRTNKSESSKVPVCWSRSKVFHPHLGRKSRAHFNLICFPPTAALLLQTHHRGYLLLPEGVGTPWLVKSDANWMCFHHSVTPDFLYDFSLAFTLFHIWRPCLQTHLKKQALGLRRQHLGYSLFNLGESNASLITLTTSFQGKDNL